MSASPYPVLPMDHSPSLEEDIDEKHRSGSSPSEAEAKPGISVEPALAAASIPSSGNWQAVWSPPHNAYYFYNSSTKETTWVNPLQLPSAASGDGDVGTTSTTAPSSSAPPSGSGSGSGPTPSTSTDGSDNPNAHQEVDPSSSSAQSSSSGATSVPPSIAQIYALQEAAAAQGIDPSLAHLDPSIAGAPSAAGGSGLYNFTAKFNAHTGAFTRPEGRDTTHLSEYERMKRMSSVYFNMEQWEQEVAQRKNREDEDAANGKKRKRPTKKDLVGCLLLSLLRCRSYPEMLIVILMQERFKEQKRLKKIAKTAWLRT